MEKRTRTAFSRTRDLNTDEIAEIKKIKEDCNKAISVVIRGAYLRWKEKNKKNLQDAKLLRAMARKRQELEKLQVKIDALVEQRVAKVEAEVVETNE